MKGEELKIANKIQIVISDALANMANTHPEIFSDGRFANWTANVMINIVCKLGQSLGEPKDRVFGMIEEIWDGLEKLSNDNNIVN